MNEPKKRSGFQYNPLLVEQTLTNATFNKSIVAKVEARKTYLESVKQDNLKVMNMTYDDAPLDMDYREFLKLKANAERSIPVIDSRLEYYKNLEQDKEFQAEVKADNKRLAKLRKQREKLLKKLQRKQKRNERRRTKTDTNKEDKAS